MFKRLLNIPRKSFFLFGPRGTGKTSLLHREFPTAYRIDLLNPQTLHELALRPQGLLERLATQVTFESFESGQA